MHEEGVVKTVRTDKGFGFLTVPNMPDIFFHITGVDPELKFDQTLVERRVQFELINTERGMKAVNVRPVE